jgi:hypothetical protein
MTDTIEIPGVHHLNVIARDGDTITYECGPVEEYRDLTSCLRSFGIAYSDDHNPRMPSYTLVTVSLDGEAALKEGLDATAEVLQKLGELDGVKTAELLALLDEVIKRRQTT